ncbi:MAG: (Fe-S)-binding protein [Pseudomonadota bacterium]|nr:(Fe-S)-binding protein [Pseudomonadota bacterium]
MNGVESGKQPTVGLLVTCLADLVRPEVGFAAVDLLRQAGCRVEVPRQTCCGQPAYNSGDENSARALARQVIEAFEAFDYLVAPSGSCAAMVRCHYPDLFANDLGWQRRARDLAGRSHELLDFLVNVMRFELPATRFDGVCTYHDSCSGLRELNIKAQPRRLLESVEGLQLREMENAEVCCGFGGTFCVKYPEISAEMADRKLDGIGQTGADYLLGGDLGCLLNIAGRAKRLGKPLKVYHVAELLAGRMETPPIGDIAETGDDETSDREDA